MNSLNLFEIDIFFFLILRTTLYRGIHLGGSNGAKGHDLTAGIAVKRN